VTGPERGSGPTPPRLSFIDGDVSFWRDGAEDWAPAQVNTAIAAGDSLYAGDNANLELELAPGAFVRAGADTEIGLESLESGLKQFKLPSGHAAVDARRLPNGQAIEIDTPNGAFTIDHAGYYRLDVDENRTTFATRRGGQATLVPANGEATDIGSDKQVVLEGTDTPQLSTNAAPDADDWDRWNLDRSGTESAPSRSAQYVPPDVAGTADLDRSGEWRDTPRYGHVWVPRDVPPDWAPYSTGRWVWDPYYGWTWVDDAPWGWAPYHYGRWVYADDYWAWAPGPVVVAPVYSPALVAFVGPSVSVSVGVPFPFVGWVALGFGEPVIPWWGPVGFVGTCWWGGWGGPHIVNNVVIQKNVFVNVRNVTVFRNERVHNAVIAVHRDHFGQGRMEHLHLTAADAHHLRPFRGQLGVKPTAASLVAKQGRGHAPPAAVYERPVVATHRPQDFSNRLHAAGLNPDAHAAPPPRLVQGRQPHGPAGEPAARRSALPPPPGGERHQSGQAGSRPASPPRHEHIARPNQGSPRDRGAPSAPVESGHRPPDVTGARERHAPPAPPRQAERNQAGRGNAAPPPPRQVERNNPGRPGAALPPPRQVERSSPGRAGGAPAPPRQVERSSPGRAGAPQFGPPPARTSGGHASAPRERPAPRGNMHQPPAGPPGARWGTPSSPRAWRAPASPERFHGPMQARPQRGRSPSRRTA
jgi:hypothetical protein